MNATQHALLARALIDACGGVDACCRPATRVERSQLYAYREIGSGAFMPADVIDALESKCGNPVYSQFLFAAHQPDGTAVSALPSVGYEIGEGGVEIQKALRLAAEDGQISENERRILEALFVAQEERVARARATISAVTP